MKTYFVAKLHKLLFISLYVEQTVHHPCSAQRYEAGSASKKIADPCSTYSHLFTRYTYRGVQSRYTVASHQKSKHKASSELGIERRSLGRLMNRVGLKMYTPRLIHGLLEDDSDRRLQVCENILSEELEGDGILNKIVWSHEANFKLSGAVNRRSCVYYATENPRITTEKQLNQPGVTVWPGLSCKGFFGPVIQHTTIDQTVYLNMLKDTIIPRVQYQDDDFYFQQDGRRGAIEWPPHSPGLTPMDFILWGTVKDKVFARKPSTVEDMIQFILEACREIDADKIFWSVHECSFSIRGVCER